MQETDRMTNGQDRAQHDEKQPSLSRRAFVSRLLAVGAVYAAPALVALNEAQAGSRYSRHSRYTRHSRHTRHSRWMRGRRPRPPYDPGGRPAQGGFREAPRTGGRNSGGNGPQGGWRPN